MNHSFIPSILDQKVCAVCRHNTTAHTPFAQCESCSFVGECDLHNEMVLCDDCISKSKLTDASIDNDEAKRNVELINHNGKEQKDPEKATFISDYQRASNESLVSSARSLDTTLERAKFIDNTIVADTSVYNAQTIATKELIDAINADSSIENKLEKIQSVILERFEHLQRAIFDKQNEVYVATQKALSLRDSLRSYGNELRKEIRERISSNDALYQPVQPKKVVTTVKREKKSAADRIIETIALEKNISIAEARREYEKIFGTIKV